MGDLLYQVRSCVIRTREELNEFGKRYHEIMIKTGKGTNSENRTDEQTSLVNKIVISMLPILEHVADRLVEQGYVRPPGMSFTFGLRGVSQIEAQKIKIPLTDIVHEGAKSIIEKFQNYDPNRSQGSVYSFILYQGIVKMSNYIVKNIPNGNRISRQVRKQNEENSNPDKKLPYMQRISIEDILEPDEDFIEKGASRKLEREYLTAKNNPEEEASIEEASREVGKLLETLTQRERTIIENRFGFNDDTQLTLRDLGKICGLSKERIRQIEVETLQKLKEIIPRDLVSLII